LSSIAIIAILFATEGAPTFGVWVFKEAAVLYLVVSTFLVLIGPKLYVLMFTDSLGKVKGPVNGKLVQMLVKNTSTTEDSSDATLADSMDLGDNFKVSPRKFCELHVFRSRSMLT
jgi:hypothetical protein